MRFQENLCLNPNSVRKRSPHLVFCIVGLKVKSEGPFPLSLRAWLQSGHANWRQKKVPRPANVYAPSYRYERTNESFLAHAMEHKHAVLYGTDGTTPLVYAE